MLFDAPRHFVRHERECEVIMISPPMFPELLFTGRGIQGFEDYNLGLQSPFPELIIEQQCRNINPQPYRRSKYGNGGEQRPHLTRLIRIITLRVSWSPETRSAS